MPSATFEQCVDLCCRSPFCYTFAWHPEEGCWVRGARQECVGHKAPGWRSATRLERSVQVRVRDLLPFGNPSRLPGWIAPEHRERLQNALESRQRTEVEMFHFASLCLGELLLGAGAQDDPETQDYWALTAAEAGLRAFAAGMDLLAASQGEPRENPPLAAKMMPSEPLALVKDPPRWLRAAIQRKLQGVSPEFARSQVYATKIYTPPPVNVCSVSLR